MNIEASKPHALLDFSTERHPNPTVSALIGEVEWRLKMSTNLKASAQLLDAQIETLRQAIACELVPKE